MMNEAPVRDGEAAVPCESQSPRPRRWLQFRLRTLLIAMVVVCLALGGWQLSVRPYVSAGPAVVGKPFVVRGRFVDFLGPEVVTYVVQVSMPEAEADEVVRKRGLVPDRTASMYGLVPEMDGGSVVFQSAGGNVRRDRYCAYDVEIELSPLYDAGEFDVGIVPLTNPVFRNGRHAAAVRGKLLVQASSSK